MKQLVQLQGNLKPFEDAGIGVVALTYDVPELQQPFIDKFSITYPMKGRMASWMTSTTMLGT